MIEENLKLSYERTTLYKTDSFEVVSIQWNSRSFSAQHNHGWSQCSVLIEEGLFENTSYLGSKIEVRRFEAGQVLTTPVGVQHEMRCLSETGRTLHVYMPKTLELSDLGRFKITNLETLQNKLKLNEPIPIDSLKQLLSEVQDHSIASHSPYFMNQLFSGVMPQMLMAEELIARTRTTMATHEASPAFSAIEAQVVESLGEIIGWKANSRDGVCVPGGSAANFMALHCARQKRFPEMKKKGMNASNLKIFVSSEAHYSFKKACAALGFGTDHLIQVPVDAQGRMKPEELENLIVMHKTESDVPFFVSATAGTTVLGAFDPIEKMSEICKRHHLWLHVDAAWGGPALFSEKTRALVKGIENADSVTFDAHKFYGANLTCSFFLTPHQGLLLEANDVSGGDYLFHTGDEARLDRGKLSWQCGRKADAVSFWTIWKSLGTRGMGDFVDQLLAVREQSLAWIKMQPRLELISTPEFLNVCVRIVPPEQNQPLADWSKYVREQLKNKNLAFVNYSTDSQGTFLRLILAHPSLQFQHVRQIFEWALDVK
jgi:glutamate/tyrosine decarboxylase-like PLP-dependent enzyme